MSFVLKAYLIQVVFICYYKSSFAVACVRIAKKYGLFVDSCDEIWQDSKRYRNNSIIRYRLSDIGYITVI